MRIIFEPSEVEDAIERYVQYTFQLKDVAIKVEKNDVGGYVASFNEAEA